MIDLHTHTNRSDGQHSPEELVLLAKSKNLSAIGITDHDEVGGLEKAMRKGAEVGVEIIPGVELSAICGDFDVHILGYFIDYHDARLLDKLHHLKAERIKRTHRILHKLEGLGMSLSFETVQRIAGEGCIGRPHVAEALVHAGLVRTFQDAFDFFLAEGKPAFEPKAKLLPAEAVALIHAAGGVASLAHPGQNLTLEVVVAVLQCGVDAIEAVHPKHTLGQRRVFEKLAQDYGLLQTGGSDFHGGARGEEKLGQFIVTREQVEQLKKLSRQWH
ncbi:MAG: PHP domain-containing protein [candidate division KSB1 bacterium]